MMEHYIIDRGSIDVWGSEDTLRVFRADVEFQGGEWVRVLLTLPAFLCLGKSMFGDSYCNVLRTVLNNTSEAISLTNTAVILCENSGDTNIPEEKVITEELVPIMLLHSVLTYDEFVNIITNIYGIEE